MTVIPLRPIIKQPSPEQRLRRRVFARLDSQICSVGCSLTIEGIARMYYPGPPHAIAQLVSVLRGKSAVETLTTLLLQGPPWWRIEAPGGITLLTAADLDPIVADWIVRFEARRRANNERYGAIWHAYNTLSESQRNELSERSLASAQRIWCQSAGNFDPRSASNRDPFSALVQACPGSEQEGPARVAQCLCERRSGACGRLPVCPPGQAGVVQRFRRGA
jgi:hypothetical protein